MVINSSDASNKRRRVRLGQRMGALCLLAALLAILSWYLLQHAVRAAPAEHAPHAVSAFKGPFGARAPFANVAAAGNVPAWLGPAVELLAALSHYAIAAALLMVARCRSASRITWLLWISAAFFLVSGTTRLLGGLNNRLPFAGSPALWELLSALLALVTAVALWWILPLAARSFGRSLEEGVRQRTGELRQDNNSLREELLARRQAAETEARLAALVENSDDAIIGKTLDGVITSWNKGAARIFGYAPEEVIGKSILVIIPPERQAEEPLILSKLRRGELVEHFDTVRRTKDGRLINVSVTSSPIRDATGTIIGVSKISRDITERKRMQAERERLLEAERAARAEAERSNRMKDEFLATLSHELRTPINAILGWSQLLSREHGRDAELNEGLEVIGRNARAQAQLVDDLLDMSRIISGKLQLRTQPVLLAGVIQDAIRTVEPAAQARQIEIKTLMESRHTPVMGDPGRLQQVVWNLLTNAVKFTPRGGRVTVRLRRIDSHVEISVSDTGQGISHEFLPHVFERFRQADSSTTRIHGGLGLGLSIVKSLVEMHGGSVEASSEGVGQGACFTIKLPVSLIRPAAAAHSDAARDRELSLSGISIVAVDDEPDARTIMRRLLEDAGATVHMASTSAEAFELLRSRQPHMLVCDIGLPEQDGYWLLRNVRELSPEAGGQTPAIALTAFARPEDRQRALAAGFAAHVSKPVEAAELLRIVKTIAEQ